MRCVACGFENASGMKFCGECGAALKARCLSCGFENPSPMKFCGECGKPLSEALKPGPIPDPRAYTPKHLAEKILTSRSALEGERKRVTVLFADVKGSMDLAEQLDPEEWHKILDGFFQILTDGVHRFEGTVNQYTGDGIMALFGAPISHEDHARRACLAVLHMREALRAYADEVRRTHATSFAARMGLNSGEVVVGKIGDDLRMDYTAQGHTVGLAQRMERLAEPGSAYLTAHTAHLIEGYFALRSLGKIALKGVGEPLGVYALEGLGSLRNPLELSRARGFSKFVGRAAELATLEAAFERSLEGRGQTVGVVADAGTGKSRLCFEFAERCRSRGFTVIEARGVAHGRRVPLLPMLELFRAYFGIQEGDAPLAVREKIAGRLLLLDERLRDDLPIFFNLLGVPDSDHPQPPMDPEALQRRAYAAVRAIVRADGQREKPGILLFEDLHWLDAVSDGYLAQIVEATETTRGLTLVNFRPEYRAGWMQSPSFLRLPLMPLGEEAVRELLADLLGNDVSVSGLAEIVHQRAGGNPFFVEEIVQTLAETGALEGTKGAYYLVRPGGEITLPATVQTVLAARIDRLPEREKRLLQQASVIGKKFSERVLKRICGLGDPDLQEAIRALRDAEFLYEESLYPQVEYAFKHPLTQEAAYRSQLSERRKEIHAAVARAIHDSYPDKIEERASELAYHWESAGEALEAAQWHRRAALWAGQTSIAEAARHWQSVRLLTEELPESAETVPLVLEASRGILNAGWLIGIPDDEADALFAEARALAERAGDLRSLALLMNFYGTIKGAQGDLRNCVASAIDSLRIAEQYGDPVLTGALHDLVIWAYALAGRLAAVPEAYSKAVTLLQSDPMAGIDFYGFSPLLSVNTAWLFSRVWMGHFDESETELTHALEIANLYRQLDVVCWLETASVLLARFAGGGAGSLDHARRAVESAEKAGTAFSRVIAGWGLGMAHGLAGDWRGSVAALEDAVTLARERRTVLIFEPTFVAYLAESYLHAGEPQRARERAEEAVALALQRGTPTLEIDAQLALARVSRSADGLYARGPIEAALERALALIKDTGARGFEPHVRLERAELARLAGDEANRLHELREAQRLFTEMGAPIRAAEVAKELRP
jgi:class 3 adenylate cyclase